MKKLDYSVEDLKELLLKELEETDSFLNETVDHYKRLRDSNNMGSLKFIADQTSNITSLRTNKINIIKELSNIEKIKIDAQVKEDNMNKGLEGDENQIKAIAREFYQLSKTDKKSANIKKLLNNSLEIDENKEKEYEDELEARMEVINAKKEEKRKLKEIEKAKEEEYKRKKEGEELNKGVETAKEEELSENEELEMDIEYQLVADIKGNVYAITLDEIPQIVPEVDTSEMKAEIIYDEDDDCYLAYYAEIEIPLYDFEEE